AVANHDRVGAVLFSDRIEGYVPPGRGRDHALRIVRDLLAREPLGRGTDLAGALRFAQRVLRRRGIVAVLSDFQAEGWERAIGVLRRRHDVVALHLADPREGEVPDAGLVAFSDPETGARVVADTSRPEVRRALRAAGYAAAQAVFKKTRVDALALSTGESYDRPLSGFFKARERRR
ncbi:MAG TPA: VWA domain-containing protein, partial [Vicinamibacteria bacterium]